jgi:hypothetical protein
MKWQRTRSSLLVLGGAIGAVAIVGVSFGASSSEGRFIDFCPTTEQTEAHLQQYGYDYKPTVVCGEDGQEAVTSGSSRPIDTEQLLREWREALLHSTRALDTDGDPLSMEIILPDGTETTIQIFGNADVFKNMTPQDLANGNFPT